jgi:hypothetical protein
MLTSDLTNHAEAARIGPLVNEAAKRGTALGRSLPLEEVLRFAQMGGVAHLIGQRVHGLLIEAEPQAFAFLLAMRRAAHARQRAPLAGRGTAR